jgi:hypothetical protein
MQSLFKPGIVLKPMTNRGHADIAVLPFDFDSNGQGFWNQFSFNSRLS